MNVDLNISLTAGACLLYLAASIGLFQARSKWPSLAALLALTLHAVSIHFELIVDGSLRFGLAGTLSLFLWQCAVLIWLFRLARALNHLGLLVYPIAAVGAAIGVLPSNVEAASFNGGWALGLHVLLSLLAYGLLTIAALQALTLSLQDRGLRHHPMPAWIGRLPPLETMEQLLFQLMGLGFFVLSLALLSGLVFVEDLFAQHLVHKTFLSVFAWLVFATLLWGRSQFGWRGRKAINWSLGGYASLLLAYFGSKWVLEVLLNTSWN